MKTLYQPLKENSPVEFVVQGFPIEEDIKSDIENFYKTAGINADRKFFVYNTFKEQIFFGNTGAEGGIESFSVSEKPFKK